MTRRNSSSAINGLLALAQIALSIASIPANIKTAQRRIEAQTAKIQLDRQRQNDMIQKQQVTAAEIALRNNKVVLADLDLEIKKLQLLKLQKEMGLLAPEFIPTDYPQ